VSEGELKNGGKRWGGPPITQIWSVRLLSIYQRVKREYILLSDKVTPQELLSMCTRARREYIPVKYPQVLLSIYQRVRREYINFSDKVTLSSPGTPFYVHQNQRGVHPPVRYPHGLLCIYQRV
jgi:hypothetical protein